ncbi:MULTISPECIES: hypothetical protein [Paenibacillus]|uniref:hypothetical protein n=1 Tax=Paenibacillus TaxID=44249 RepID=UPI000309ACAF|nr:MULTISPECIES: hypothetical protein [Paenibacillus]KKD53970.1 hypothetical protein C400_16190 [Paenibacillus sp. ICGEB2008]
MPENNSKSPILVDKTIGIKNEKAAECVKHILSYLGKQSCSVGTALLILDKAKEAATNCTLMQTEYINEIDSML